MSVSYNRVNWADYPATTTPVNATNLNKMDKGIADLTREVNSVESSVSNLNSSLTASDGLGFQFMTDGDGNYGYRGADDSFVPFSKNQTVIFQYISQPGLNTPYTIIRNGNIESYNSLQEMVDAAPEYVRSIDSWYFTVNKAGTWMRQQVELAYKTPGQTIYLTNQYWMIVFVSEENILN